MTQTDIRAIHAIGSVEGRAGDIQRRRWFKMLARAGLGARAVIYFLIAYLTADIARHGQSPAPADSNGAFHELAREPAGPAVLFVVAIGLFGYALWRLVSAAALADHRSHGSVKRFGLAASGVLYLGLCAQAVALAVSSKTTGGASSNPTPMAATVLRWPGGPLFVGLCAAGLVGGALALLIWGWVHDYARVLDRSLMGRRTYGIARVTGIIGDTVRALLIGLIGVYLMTSAVTDNPTKVKALDQALEALAHKPYGVWLLSIAAAGLVSFGVYSALEARYRRL
jgi:hypothetical protein